MKWVGTEERDNTGAVSRQSVVHEIHGVNSNALRKLGYTGKKAGTCALEPHTLSPEALGRHPVLRRGRVRQPDFFPGALGPRAFNWFHAHSWPERVRQGPSASGPVQILGFVATACPAPCSQATPVEHVLPAFHSP